MIALLVWTICAFALSWIVSSSHITLPFREALDTMKRKGIVGAGFFLTLLECVGCFGVWEGVGGFLIHLTPSELTTWWIAALFTCGTNLLLGKWVGLLDD